MPIDIHLTTGKNIAINTLNDNQIVELIDRIEEARRGDEPFIWIPCYIDGRNREGIHVDANHIIGLEIE